MLNPAEFLAIRKNHTFFECCQTPALASALTLQPIDRYPRLDASIIFCDILVVPQALGMVVEMQPEKGPVLPSPLRSPADLPRLRQHVDVDKELGYLFEAITMTRMGLGGRVPLIGFCGAPWTLMAYMCEGGGSKTFQWSKGWLYRWPEESERLLRRIADVCADLLVGQVLAGAQVSAGGRVRARARARAAPSFRACGRANRGTCTPSHPARISIPTLCSPPDAPSV